MRSGLEQELGFRLVAARERVRLIRGVQLLDLGAKPRALTSVIRIPADVASALAGLVAGLPALDGHYLYPSSDLHLTVLNLDDAPGLSTETTVVVAAAVLTETAPFPVVLGGLSLSRSTVYARAYDPSGMLRVARHRLARATGCRAPGALRLLGFVNLARFTRPLDAGSAAAVASLPPVEALRGEAARRASSRFEVTSVEIVRTDVVLSAAGTEVLRTVRLSAQHP